MNVIIMIPSLNPDETLIQVVSAIRLQGFTRFLIINDGSQAESRHVFDRLANEGCTVVNHAVNMGKGRALKTGFNYVLQHMNDAAGVVTCDADGQHEPAAIRAVALALLAHPGKVILGTRKFFEAKVPLANLMGNTITRMVFWLLTGLRFGDTQCGLRAFPMSSLPNLMAVGGERFEYENVMLLAFRENKQDYIEVPINAVYASEGTQVSHFNKAVDSVRIYKKLLGFAAAPMFAGFSSSMLFMVASLAAGAGHGNWNLPIALIATLIGWLVVWVAAPAKNSATAAGVTALSLALFAALFYLFSGVLALPANGAWWLSAVVCAPLNYSMWLWSRCGRRPSRSILA